MFLKPVRKIGYSNRAVTGKRASTKSSRILQFESSLERDLITLLEYDEEVETCTPQPVTIHYDDGQKQRRYTPDIAVYYDPTTKRKPELIEVKYQAELDEKHAEYALRFAAADQYAAANGYVFKVITEKEIRTDRLYNIKFLSRYVHSYTDDARATGILTTLNNNQQISVRAIAGDDPDLLFIIWQLVARKLLLCDMTTKLNMDTLLWKTL